LFVFLHGHAHEVLVKKFAYAYLQYSLKQADLQDLHSFCFVFGLSGQHKPVAPSAHSGDKPRRAGIWLNLLA
jgi:hypothetical protein